MPAPIFSKIEKRTNQPPATNTMPSITRIDGHTIAALSRDHVAPTKLEPDATNGHCLPPQSWDKDTLSARCLHLPDGPYLLLRYKAWVTSFAQKSYQEDKAKMQRLGYLDDDTSSGFNFLLPEHINLTLRRGCIAEGRNRRVLMGMDPNRRLVCIVEQSLKYAVTSSACSEDEKVELSPQQAAQLRLQTLREAKLMADIDHPATPRYVLERTDGRKLYLIMPLARLQLYNNRGLEGAPLTPGHYMPNFGFYMPVRHLKLPERHYWQKVKEQVIKSTYGFSLQDRNISLEKKEFREFCIEWMEKNLSTRFAVELAELASPGFTSRPIRLLRFGLHVLEVGARTLSALHQKNILHNHVCEESFMVADDSRQLWLGQLDGCIDLNRQIPWQGECVGFDTWPSKQLIAPELFKPYYNHATLVNLKGSKLCYPNGKPWIMEYENYATANMVCHHQRLSLQEWLTADVYALGLTVLRLVSGYPQLPRFCLPQNHGSMLRSRNPQASSSNMSFKEVEKASMGYLVEQRIIGEYFSERGLGKRVDSDQLPEFAEEVEEINYFWQRIEQLDIDWARFVAKMVAFEPKNRPSAQEVVAFCENHPLKLRIANLRHVSGSCKPDDVETMQLHESPFVQCLGDSFEVHWARQQINDLDQLLGELGLMDRSNHLGPSISVATFDPTSILHAGGSGSVKPTNAIAPSTSHNWVDIPPPEGPQMFTSAKCHNLAMRLEFNRTPFEPECLIIRNDFQMFLLDPLRMHLVKPSIKAFAYLKQHWNLVRWLVGIAGGIGLTGFFLRVCSAMLQRRALRSD